MIINGQFRSDLNTEVCTVSRGVIFDKSYFSSKQNIPLEYVGTQECSLNLFSPNLIDNAAKVTYVDIKKSNCTSDIFNQVQKRSPKFILVGTGTSLVGLIFFINKV